MAVMRVGMCRTVVLVSTCKLLLELLHIPVTFVRGPTVSSTRFIRKRSQFRVPSFYAAPTVPACAGEHMHITHETSTIHIIFNG